MAAMGKQLKQSVNVFHSLMLYRLLPASPKIDDQTTIRDIDQEPPTFVVKPVDSVDTGALVIASQDEEVFWVFDLSEAPII
jgi:hypothetical protein